MTSKLDYFEYSKVTYKKKLKVLLLLPQYKTVVNLALALKVSRNSLASWLKNTDIINTVNKGKIDWCYCNEYILPRLRSEELVIVSFEPPSLNVDRANFLTRKNIDACVVYMTSYQDDLDSRLNVDIFETDKLPKGLLRKEYLLAINLRSAFINLNHELSSGTLEASYLHVWDKLLRSGIDASEFDNNGDSCHSYLLEPSDRWSGAVSAYVNYNKSCDFIYNSSQLGFLALTWRYLILNSYPPLLSPNLVVLHNVILSNFTEQDIDVRTVNVFFNYLSYRTQQFLSD